MLVLFFALDCASKVVYMLRPNQIISMETILSLFIICVLIGMIFKILKYLSGWFFLILGILGIVLFFSFLPYIIGLFLCVLLFRFFQGVYLGIKQKKYQKQENYSSYSENYSENRQEEYSYQEKNETQTCGTDLEDTYLAILELERSQLTPNNLRKNYRRLVKKYHPDLHPNDPSVAQKFILLTEAYDYFLQRV